MVCSLVGYLYPAHHSEYRSFPRQVYSAVRKNRSSKDPAHSPANERATPKGEWLCKFGHINTGTKVTKPPRTTKRQGICRTSNLLRSTRFRAGRTHRTLTRRCGFTQRQEQMSWGIVCSIPMGESVTLGAEKDTKNSNQPCFKKLSTRCRSVD